MRAVKIGMSGSKKNLSGGLVGMSGSKKRENDDHGQRRSSNIIERRSGVVDISQQQNIFQMICANKICVIPNIAWKKLYNWLLIA